MGGIVAERLAAHIGIALERLARAPERPGWTTVDWEALVDDPRAAGTGDVDVGVCCLGTTRARAGSDAAFRRVDLDYVAAFTRACRARKATRFVLVSSVGAGGGGLYLRTKGDAEASARAAGFASVDLLRPSLLLGPRIERRPGEMLAQALAPFLSPFLLGPLARYAAVDATTVASAVVALVVDPPGDGVRVHEVPELRRLAAAPATGQEAR